MYAMGATGAVGHVFSSWVVSTNWSGGVTSTAPVLRFLMQSNLTLQVNFKDVTRPTVGFSSPVNYQQWGYSMFTVKGVAKDNAQVSSVFYRVNGAGAWTQAAGTTNWTATIGPLPYGTNLISAYALDATGNSSTTNSVRLVYNQFLPVKGNYYGLFAEPAPAVRRRPTR
jgi:hypothetical protein